MLPRPIHPTRSGTCELDDVAAIVNVRNPKSCEPELLLVVQQFIDGAKGHLEFEVK
jgi:hypothetical protein